jgi:hypothetical protein
MVHLLRVASEAVATRGHVRPVLAVTVSTPVVAARGMRPRKFLVTRATRRVQTSMGLVAVLALRVLRAGCSLGAGSLGWVATATLRPPNRRRPMRRVTRRAASVARRSELGLLAPMTGRAGLGRRWLMGQVTGRAALVFRLRPSSHPGHLRGMAAVTAGRGRGFVR